MSYNNIYIMICKNKTNLLQYSSHPCVIVIKTIIIFKFSNAHPLNCLFLQCLYGNCFHKHNLICVNLNSMQNCQNGLAFVNFTLKLLLGC